MRRAKKWRDIGEIAEAIWSPEEIAWMTSPEKVRAWKEGDAVLHLLDVLAASSLPDGVVDSVAAYLAGDEMLSNRARHEASRFRIRRQQRAAADERALRQAEREERAMRHALGVGNHLSVESESHPTSPSESDEYNPFLEPTRPPDTA